MNVIFFTGNIRQDAESRSTRAGEVVNFSVAVQQGFGRDAETAWYRCSIWGQRGVNLLPHLKKGTKVVVMGTLKIGEYNDKPTYEVSVTEIGPFIGYPRRDDNDNRGSSRPSSGGRQERFDEDLDDDVPF